MHSARKLVIALAQAQAEKKALIDAQKNASEKRQLVERLYQGLTGPHGAAFEHTVAYDLISLQAKLLLDGSFFLSLLSIFLFSFTSPHLFCILCVRFAFGRRPGNLRKIRWIKHQGLLRWLLDLQFTGGRSVIDKIRGGGGAGQGNGGGVLLVDYQRANLPIPSNSTLDALKGEPDFSCGVNQRLVDELAAVVKLVDADPRVAVSHDEVSSRAAIVFDPEHGYMVGLKSGLVKIDDIIASDLQALTPKDLANNVLVTIATTLDGSVKRVIGWHFTNSYGAEWLIEHINEVAAAISATENLKLAIVTSDSPSNNLSVLTHFQNERLERRVSFFVLPDYTHLTKNLVHNLRKSPKNQFVSPDGVCISLRVLLKLKKHKDTKAAFAHISQKAHMFPSDLQKVAPLLTLLSCSTLLRQHARFAGGQYEDEALALAVFFEHVEVFNNASMIKRTSDQQSNTSVPPRPVRTLDQRVRDIVECGQYFDLVCFRDASSVCRNNSVVLM
jgi:hypothetical protein